jgi:voltage-gated potassium channel
MLVIANIVRAHRRRRLTKHLSGSIYKRISRLVVLLAGLVVLNSLAMVYFEKLSLGDAVWLSLTTLTTVGYGDFSASTGPGRFITVVTMYGFAISLLSILVAELIDWKMLSTNKKLKGYWEFNMVDHIQIINTPNVDTERFLQRLIKEIQATPAFSETPIQLLTRKYPEGLPESLSCLKLIHRTGSAEDGSTLNSIGLHNAKHIVILARDSYDSLSDCLTFDILSRVTQINPNANIVVEAILDENRQRFKSLGASAVLRPIRAYPEMIARALSHPGTERVLEDLFDANGDSLHKVPCKFSNRTWAEIVTACIQTRIGTPLGYFVKGEVIMQPSFDEICSGEALALLVKKENRTDCSDLERSLAA